MEAIGSRVPLRQAQKRSLADDITDQVAQLIADGALEVGDRLPAERELCRRFGVSRMAVREALRALSVMGLIDVRHGAGIYVANPALEAPLRQLMWSVRLGPMEARELFAVRRLLEEEAAYLAAARVARGETDTAELNAALQEMEALREDGPAFARADVEFHVALAEASGNRVLARLTRGIRELMVQYVTASGPRVESALGFHGRIRDAVAAGDPAAARQAMREHLDHAAVGTLGLVLQGEDDASSNGTSH